MLYIYIYEGVEIVYDYHYCQRILRVNVFLYESEVVRRLPKNAVNYFLLSLHIIFYKNMDYDYNIINNDDYRIQDTVLLLTIPMGTRKNLSEKAFRLTLTAFFQAVFPNGLTTPYLVYFLKM
jgi:hypothetical protein